MADIMENDNIRINVGLLWKFTNYFFNCVSCVAALNKIWFPVTATCETVKAMIGYITMEIRVDRSKE